MKPTIKPRNPVVVPAKFRKAGTHLKTFKTHRRHERIELRRTARSFRSNENKTPEFQPKQPDIGFFGWDSASSSDYFSGEVHASRNHSSFSRYLKALPTGFKSY
jgi:hypothetical protein